MLRLSLPAGLFSALLPLLTPAVRAEGDWIDLSSDSKAHEGWRKLPPGWVIGGDVALDPKNPRRLVSRPGAGVLSNGPRGRARDLVTRQKFTDVEVHVEFCIAKGSNSGVKLMGLYEIQILDSHGKKKLSGDSCGGIYPRAEDRPRYRHIDEGVAPLTNAALPAGKWQTLAITFQAPRFKAGKKVANARFVKVVLNGQLVQDNVEVKYPTGAAWRLRKEIPQGPLLLQGDHGPVAFRNVRLRPWKPGKPAGSASTKR